MFNYQNIVEMSLKQLVIDTDKEIGQVIHASVKRAMEDECPCCCSCGCNVEFNRKTTRLIKQIEKSIARGDLQRTVNFDFDELTNELERDLNDPK